VMAQFEKVLLRSGKCMPRFGLGTWLGGEAAAVAHALKLGYRLVDTANMYGNEEMIGDVLEKSGVSREEIFLVTKLDVKLHGNPRKSLLESLQKLKTPYVDLFLIHTPSPGRVVSTWKEMLKLRDEGLARSVGVSNFGTEHIRGLANEKLELPEVNQIELHVFLQQKEHVKYCNENGIAVMGYCPLARCKRFGACDVLTDVAKKHGVSEGAVMIRFSYQRGHVTIPKTSSVERVAENLRAITDLVLDEDDMSRLDTLDDGFLASSAVKSMNLPWDEVK